MLGNKSRSVPIPDFKIGERAQQLPALAALGSSVPSTHLTAYNSCGTGDPASSSSDQKHLHSHAHAHARHIHIIQNDKNKYFKLSKVENNCRRYLILIFGLYKHIRPCTHICTQPQDHAHTHAFTCAQICTSSHTTMHTHVQLCT